MQLDLIDAEHASGAGLLRLPLLHVGLQLIEMLHAIVRHADGADFPRGQRFDESVPCAETVFTAADWLGIGLELIGGLMHSQSRERRQAEEDIHGACSSMRSIYPNALHFSKLSSTFFFAPS